MKSFLAFLISDWRRKLAAIAIALVLWSWIEGRLANDVELSLKIAFTTEDIGAPDELQLLIQAPPGWILTEPQIGSRLTVWVSGSKSEVQSFRDTQCAANYVANFIPNEDDHLYTVDVLPEELDWMRPGDAALLLSGIPDSKKILKQLVFERVKTEIVTLTPREIFVEDNSSEAYEAKTEELVFTPNTVTISGPLTAVESLLAEVEAARSPTGTQLESDLLNTLKIPGGSRNDISQRVMLNDRWGRKGITMHPAEVLVSAKVRLKQPSSFDFFPSPEDLQVIYSTDPAAADIWEYVWEPGGWTISLPHVEGTDLLSSAWVQDHVRLFLPLHTLDADSGSELTSQKVRIEAHIVGFEDPDEQSFFEQHVVIKPKAGSENDMVTVKRKQ